MKSRGLLVMNGFVGEESFLSLRAALLRAADRVGLALDYRGNEELLFEAVSGEPLFDISPYSFCIFWDKDVPLARMLEGAGLRLFNPAGAIALCDDKLSTHQALSGLLPMPETIAVPMTYRYVGYGDMPFLPRAAERLGLPMIIKECCGSFGKQVYLARTIAEAEEIIRGHEAAPMLMQRAVTEAFGRDIRIYIAGGRAVAAMERLNPHDFRANIANGGASRPYSPTPEEEALALRAAALLGLDFAGVDLLRGKEGPLLCEVNSNAHFRGLESCTGADIAGEILRHVLRCMQA